MKCLKINLLLALMAISTIAICQDFRNAKFGMSMDEVMKTEELELKKVEGGFLTGGPVELVGHNFVVSFGFDNGKFIIGQYHSDKETNGSDLYMKYLEMVEALMGKYGKFSVSDTKWKTESHKTLYGGIDNLPFAIEMGYAEPFTVWVDNGRKIAVLIQGNIVVVGYMAAEEKKKSTDGL